MELRVTVLGEDLVRRQLMAMGDRAEDASPAMHAILAGLYASTAKRFDTGGAYGGDPWPANRPSTVETKARQGLDPRVEHATGTLRDSLTRAGGHSVARVTGSGVSLGTTVSYAKYQRVQLVQPPEADRRQWVRILQRHIVDGGRNGGILRGVI